MERGGRLPDAGDQASHAAQGADSEYRGAGLPFCAATLPHAMPRYPISNVIAPTRMIGMDATSSLKLSFWHATVEDSPQVGDPAFIGISLRTDGDKAWRDASPNPSSNWFRFREGWKGRRYLSHRIRYH